jgi:hypothetical protein
MTKLLKESVTPAEGEASVKAYHCTYYKSWLLGLSASGYLEVTNKRVIFQACGKSSAGTSIIHSEVPIADVSGISTYKGTYFSIGHLLAAVVASFIAFSLVPFVITIVQDYDTLIYVRWGIALLGFVGSFFVSKQSIWRCVLVSSSASALLVVGIISSFFNFLGSIFGFGNGSNNWSILLGFLVAIYALICLFWYARRPTFSLSVSSKGGSSTPINISGATGIGIFDIAAGKALTAEPADEAEKLLKELGAVILDIQTLGDFGISKWKSI